MTESLAQHAGVRFLASTTEDLVAALKARQARVAEIVEERRPPHATGRLSELVDGIWSPTTIRAVRRLNVVGLQLNTLWASLPQGWVCPCCRRSKDATIFTAPIDKDVPEKGRVAIAHAVEHHDHFVSYVNHAFHAALGPNWARDFPAAAEVQRRLAFGVTSFDPTIVCEACNFAEGQAKMLLWRRVKLDRDFREYFSFALDEIRTFIRAMPNAHHQISEAAVMEVFERRRKLEVMAFRKREVDTQVRLVKEGIHWRSAEPPAPDANAVNESYQMTLLEFGLEHGPNFSFDQLSATSQGQTVDPDAWIEKRAKRTGFVMDKEAEEFLANDYMSKELGRNWSCPCCSRSIRAAIRRNNKRTLTLQPRVVRPGGAEPQTVCIDCCTSMQRIAGSAEAARDDVTFEDVREVFAFASNEPHRTRSAALARMVIERVGRRAASARAAMEAEFSQIAVQRLATDRPVRAGTSSARIRRPTGAGGLY